MKRWGVRWLLVFVCCPAPVWAEPWGLEGRLQLPGDFWAAPVAVSGDTAVVSAVLDDENGPRSGAVFVFTREGDGWIRQAKLLPHDGSAWDDFGWSVGIDGNTVVVGAPGDDDYGSQSGAAYVFEREKSVWAERAKLRRSDGAAEDRFGTRVAIDGATALVAAYGDEDNGFLSGSAYVFVPLYNTWVMQAKLVPGDGAELDGFGWGIAIDADTAVIGAIGDDDNGNHSGSAYVFTRLGGLWTEQAKLFPSDPESGADFGWSAAIDGDTAVIGDPDSTGSAYVFTRLGEVWTEQAKLQASDGGVGDDFGESVGLEGDMAVIGAYRHNGDDEWSGAAYVFARAGSVWTEQSKFVPPDPRHHSRFGESVGLDGDTAIIGAGGRNRAYSFRNFIDPGR